VPGFWNIVWVCYFSGCDDHCCQGIVYGTWPCGEPWRELSITSTLWSKGLSFRILTKEVRPSNALYIHQVAVYSGSFWLRNDSPTKQKVPTPQVQAQQMHNTDPQQLAYWSTIPPSQTPHSESISLPQSIPRSTQLGQSTRDCNSRLMRWRGGGRELRRRLRKILAM
jgi:hypothetical protein